MWHRECLWCGTPFTTSNPRQTYCPDPRKSCVRRACAFRTGRRLHSDGTPTSSADVMVEVADGGWRERAACRDADPPDLFFPVAPFHAQARALAEYDRLVADLKAICNTCPVRQECLDYALVTRVEYGVWGGLTEDERRQIRARARRAS